MDRERSSHEESKATDIASVLEYLLHILSIVSE